MAASADLPPLSAPGNGPGGAQTEDAKNPRGVKGSKPEKDASRSVEAHHTRSPEPPPIQGPTAREVQGFIRVKEEVGPCRQGEGDRSKAAQTLFGRRLPERLERHRLLNPEGAHSQTLQTDDVRQGSGGTREVLDKNTHVRPRTASNPEPEPVPVHGLEIQCVHPHRSRGPLDHEAAVGPLVKPPTFVVDRRVHGRNLKNPAKKRFTSPLETNRHIGGNRSLLDGLP